MIRQLIPPATTATQMLKVQAGQSITVTRLSVCNTTGAAITFRFAIVPGNETLATCHCVYADFPIQPNDTFNDSNGFDLKENDVVSVYASSTGVAFSLFGTINTI